MRFGKHASESNNDFTPSEPMLLPLFELIFVGLSRELGRGEFNTQIQTETQNKVPNLFFKVDSYNKYII